MNDHEYTPTTGRVRHCATHGDAWLSFQPESFDRWLTAHDAEIRTATLEEAAAIAELHSTRPGHCSGCDMALAIAAYIRRRGGEN